ncbi:unnamed protein product, partial [Discosporangium mesarthrocarpum]
GHQRHTKGRGVLGGAHRQGKQGQVESMHRGEGEREGGVAQGQRKGKGLGGSVQGTWTCEEATEPSQGASKSSQEGWASFADLREAALVSREGVRDRSRTGGDGLATDRNRRSSATQAYLEVCTSLGVKVNNLICERLDCLRNSSTTAMALGCLDTSSCRLNDLDVQVLLDALRTWRAYHVGIRASAPGVSLSASRVTTEGQPSEQTSPVMEVSPGTSQGRGIEVAEARTAGMGLILSGNPGLGSPALHALCHPGPLQLLPFLTTLDLSSCSLKACHLSALALPTTAPLPTTSAQEERWARNWGKGGGGSPGPETDTLSATATATAHSSGSVE